MRENDPELVSSLVADILGSRKYRHLCPETVHNVVCQEFARQENARTAIRIARERLHRLWAQFLGEPDYGSSVRELTAAFESNEGGRVAHACLDVLRSHASTRERVPELARVYSQIFAHTGIPVRIADLACAFAPLAFRWMGLPRSVEYHAFDINQRIVDLINKYFQLEGIQPRAALRDVLCTPINERIDVALLFKMYHCLEHRERGAGWRVVEAVPAKWVAISFPTRNLQGHLVDIIGNYESVIVENAVHRGWSHSRLNFETEDIVLIDKGGAVG